MCFKKNHNMLKKPWLKQMELIIKICDPPPPLFPPEKSLINYGTFFLYGELEFGCICLYRAHAERVGGRFTYNQLK